jgi:hypothetical protein
MIGKTHWEVWPWSVGTIVEQNYRQAVAEQMSVHFEVLYEPLTMWLEIHAYPSPQGLNLYFRDASNYKQEGQGATFTVCLTLVSDQPKLPIASELPKSELNLAGIRALVVDDEPDTRQVLAVILEAYGAEVMTLANATEVFTQLEQFQPQVLVSDVGMPNVDGYRLLQ